MANEGDWVTFNQRNIKKMEIIFWLWWILIELSESALHCIALRTPIFWMRLKIQSSDWEKVTERDRERESALIATVRILSVNRSFIYGSDQIGCPMSIKWHVAVLNRVPNWNWNEFGRGLDYYRQRCSV